MSKNRAFKSDKWKDSTFKKGEKEYNKTRKKKPKVECINMGKYVFCNKNKSKKKKDEKPKAKPKEQPKPKPKAKTKKTAKEILMSRATKPKRKAKPKVKKEEPKKTAKEMLMSRATKPKRKAKPKVKAPKKEPKKEEPKIDKEFERIFKEMKMYEKDSVEFGNKELKIKDLRKEMKEKNIKTKSELKKLRMEKTETFKMLKETQKRLKNSVRKYVGTDMYEKVRKKNLKTFRSVRKNDLIIGIKERLKTNFDKLMKKM